MCEVSGVVPVIFVILRGLSNQISRFSAVCVCVLSPLSCFLWGALGSVFCFDSKDMIAHFTENIYDIGIALSVSGGDPAPLVGHNAFLR